MPSHEERAREICSPEYFGGVRANDAQHIADVARALAEVELEAYERAAKCAEQVANDFLSPQYATPQPIGSIQERFACKTVANAIRSLSRNETGGGN